MTSIEITVTGAAAVARKQGLLTAGMTGIPVRFTFSPEWEDLHIIPVFRCGGILRDNALENGMATVPFEVMQPGTLYIGCEGRNADGTVVIPTVWALAGQVLESANASGNEALAPTPSQYDRLDARITTLENGGIPEASLPQTLPNPHPLTIGTQTYDGSAPVEITMADGTAPWRCIADITTEEEVDTVLITKDTAGEPFALTELVYHIQAKANAAGSTTGYFRVGIDPNNRHNKLAQTIAGLPATGSRYMMGRFTLIGDKWIAEDSYNHNASNLSVGGYVEHLASDYSIKTPAAAFHFNPMGTIGVGSRVIVYGR